MTLHQKQKVQAVGSGSRSRIVGGTVARAATALISVVAHLACFLFLV